MCTWNRLLSVLSVAAKSRSVAIGALVSGAANMSEVSSRNISSVGIGTLRITQELARDPHSINKAVCLFVSSVDSWCEVEDVRERGTLEVFRLFGFVVGWATSTDG